MFVKFSMLVKPMLFCECHFLFFILGEGERGIQLTMTTIQRKNQYDKYTLL
mgnify:CR=1 FL=1